MANNILAAGDYPHNAKTTDLLYQNTPLLAELLKLSYQDYAKQANLNTQAFIVGIREMVTHLIEPICQQSSQGSENYLPYLEQFNQYNRGDFIQYPGALTLIAFALTRLVQYAIESFRERDYPQPYDQFIHLFESIFKNDSIIEHNHYRNVILMMGQLRQKPLN